MENSENTNGYSNEAEALKILSAVLSLLSPLTVADRERILHTIGTFFNLSILAPTAPVSNRFHVESSSQIRSGGGELQNRSITAKSFLMEKQPKTDVERVACLAYYLTHFKDTQYFKTIDITNLNTEAAQPKFSNAAKATGNATEYGYLAPANKGNRQLSAAGEVFVQTLPDREAARLAMSAARPKKNNSPKKKKSTSHEDISSDE